MTVEQYLEWMAYDSIEPLDPAGTLLRGFASSGKEAPPPSDQPNWMQQKMNMLRWGAVFGKKKK